MAGQVPEFMSTGRGGGDARFGADADAVTAFVLAALQPVVQETYGYMGLLEEVFPGPSKPSPFTADAAHNSRVVLQTLIARNAEALNDLFQSFVDVAPCRVASPKTVARVMSVATAAAAAQPDDVLDACPAGHGCSVSDDDDDASDDDGTSDTDNANSRALVNQLVAEAALVHLFVPSTPVLCALWARACGA